jgi:hypothetical protein
MLYVTLPLVRVHVWSTRSETETTLHLYLTNCAASDVGVRVECTAVWYGNVAQ